jgi:C-terminal processing protease CtpA/Prc
MRVTRVFALAFVLVSVSGIVRSQNLEFERSRHKDMLRFVKEDVKKNYFDPTFKGIDIEASHKIAAEKMDKAQSIGQMSGIIAQFLIDFDDSHLFFLPPGKANKTDYGFDYRMAGPKCFIVSVDKKSEAEKLGLQVGDELLSIEGFQPTRETLWKIRYLFNRLRPQLGLNLIIQKPDGREIRYAIPSTIKQGKKVMDLTGRDLNEYIRESEDAYRKQVKQYFYDKLDGAFIWKMPSFSLEPEKVDEIIGRAKKAPALILDLRANGGGRVDMLMRLIANVIDQDLKVADEKRRKETKELITKSRGKDAYAGKIVVLIDSGSASASEIFARVIQLEKRGLILGDRSAGAVMESRYFGRQSGMDTVIFYGASVTIADLIMKDGKSLEKNGVVPDVTIIPTGKDVAAKRDVALAKALESVGVTITPEVAGSIFPEDVDDID